MMRTSTMRAGFAAMLVTGLVTMGAGAAHADGTDPVGDVVNQVKKSVDDATGKKSTGATVPSKDAPDPPVSDDDSPGYESTNPSSPDHASSQAGHVEVGGQDVVGIGSDKATTNDDDSSEADSTLLAVGGQEVIGAHAKSDGGPGSSHGGAPEIPACEQSDGAFCLDLLYSDAYATDDGTRSDSKSQSGLANLCLGGSDATGETCDGGATVDLASSRSVTHRNQHSGRTTGSARSGLANVCVQREGDACTATADAISSSGRSDSDGSTSRSSQVANFAIAGQALGAPNDAFAIAVPPPVPGGEVDCTHPTTPPTLLCLFGNQGETYFGDNVVGHSQTALTAMGLDQNLLAILGHSETLVHNDGGEAVVRPPSTPNHPTNPAHPRPATQVHDGLLPNTGGVWSGLLGIGLALFGMGAVATAWDRRRVAV